MKKRNHLKKIMPVSRRLVSLLFHDNRGHEKRLRLWPKPSGTLKIGRVEPFHHHLCRSKDLCDFERRAGHRVGYGAVDFS